MKKRGLLCLFAGMALMSFTIFNSCEIGLGESVDVESPVIIFDENPPTSAVIRSAFPVSGTWKDDGSISKVSVVLENLATHTKYTFDGTIKDNTWSATIDPIKSKIPDGKYEATITLSDNGGHTSSSSRSFTIDNTAPVVVLSRPSSEADESDENKIESYGQYLTLEGQAADDNNIECIIVKFYSKEDPDTLIGQKKIESIPPTISLDIAHYLDKDIYSAIYGDDKEKGDQYYFCTISAFDSAKQYFVNAKGIVEEEDLGNEESSYILWSKWEQFQLDYQKTTGSSSKIKLPELYAIKAGTNADSKARSAGENALITNFFNDTTPRASFKLNPKNNPSFSISGLDIGLENDVENDRPLTIQLAKGLDGLSLDTEKMKVYLIPLDEDENGKIVRGKKIYPQQSEYQNRGDGQFLTIIQKDNVKDENGNAVSLEYSKVYVIGVEGKDIEGNQIVPSFDGKEFFIRFKAKNVAPGLTITSPSPTTSYLMKGKSLKITGTTSVPDGYPTISITCKKGEEITGQEIYSHKVTEADKVKVEGGLIIYNFEYEIPTDGNKFKFDQTQSNQYVFDITSDMDNMPTTRTKTVIYDIDGPTISIDSMLPTARKYNLDLEDGSGEDGYLNGDVTMKVSILDDYDTVQTALEEGKEDRRPYFIIVDENGTELPFKVGTETKATVKHYITTPAKQAFIIHTKDIADGSVIKKIYVKIFAEDRAGNKGVDIEDTSKSSFERDYTIDQSTDAPVILPKTANTNTVKLSEDDIKKESNFKNMYSANQPASYRLIDDDGLSSVTYKISGTNYNTESDPQALYDATESSLDIIMPEDPGIYNVEISVTDNKNNPAVTKNFYVRVTATAPAIKSIKFDKDPVGIGENIVAHVAIKSDQKPFTLIRTIKNSNNDVLSETTLSKNEIPELNSENPTVTDSFSLTEAGITISGDYKVYYEVRDVNYKAQNPKYGTGDESITVDLNKPVISEVKLASENHENSKWYNSKNLALSLIAEDKQADDTGVSQVRYSLDDGQNWIPLAKSGSVYSGTVIFQNDSDNNTLRILAEDAAGNAAEKTATVKIDTITPVVTYTATNLKNAAGETVTSITSGDYYSGEAAVSITGIVSDTNFENSASYVTVEATNSATNITPVFVAGTYKFTITPTIQDGETKITITVKDFAGNTKENIITIHRDTKGPGIEIKLPQADSTNPLDDESYTFRINANDGNDGVGVAKIYYKFTNDNSTPTDWGTGETFSGGDFYISRDLIKGHVAADGKLTEGNWYLHVKAEDKSGNVTTTNKNATDTKLRPRYFVVDKEAPSIDYVKYEDSVLTEKQNFYYDATTFTLTGSVSDTNGIKQVKVGGDIVEVTNKTWSKAITITPNQRNEIIVEVEDVAGRKTPKTYYVYKDSVAPVINLNAPAASVGTLTDEKYKFVGSVSDAGSGIQEAKYLFTQTPFANENAIKTSASTGTGWASIDNGELSVEKNLGGTAAANLKEGRWYLYIYAKDNVSGSDANHVSVFSKPFWVDRALPTLTETTVNTTGAQVKAGGKLTLSGTASDNNEIENIVITDGTGENAKNWTIAGTAITNGNWSKEINPGTDTQTENKLTDGTHTLTITATDKAGRSSSVQRTVVVDTAAPTHGTLSVTSTGATVGTGDAAKTWYKSSFINIEIVDVADPANGSGVSTVEYTIDNGAHWNPMSGSEGTYTATVNCTSQGSNTIKVQIKDVVGNVKDAGGKTVYVDTVLPTLTTSKVKYRTTNYESSSEILVNGDYGYDLQIEVADAETSGTDMNSGIAAVKYAYGNHTIAATQSGNYWIVNVPVTNGVDKYDPDKTNPIYALITDKAGNEAKERILTVTKDTDPPSVEFKSVTTPGSTTKVAGVYVDDVNGTITITGSASDVNKLADVVLQYTDGSKDSKGNVIWKPISRTDNNTPNNWTAELATTSLTDNTKYTLKAIATDAAGNTKEATKDIYVNQDTDRPVITLTNIDLTVATFGNNEIYGNVSDDDGVPASISYYIGNDEPDENTTWTPPAANSNFTYTSGSFKLKLADGSQKIWFKVNDGTNDFVSSSETSYTNETSEKILKSVKVVDSQSNKFGYLPESGETITSSVINTTVDTTAPYITKLEWAYPEATGTQVWQSINSKPTAGGTGSKTNINIHVYAYDINGVDTVKLMVPKNSSDKSTVSGYSTEEEDLDEKYYIYNFTKDETSTYDDEDSNITYIKWTSPAIIATGMESGIRECKLQVFDGEKTTQETVSLTIDNTPADFEITNYADNQTVYGIKDIEVQGMVTANDMAHVYYCLTKGDITTAPAAGNSWKTIKFENSRLNSVIKFDGDTNATDVTHEIRLRDWLKTLYVIDDIDNHNDTEKLKLWTYVVDTMENSSEPKALTLNVIPNGDKPVVKIIYPGEGLKLGGTIRFSGETTIETSSVDKVYAQIIVPDSIDNSNDDWVTKLDKLISDAKNKSTGSEPYYKVVNIDSNTKGIEVSGTPTSWNFAINSHHELEKDNATPNYTVNFIAKSATNKLSDTMTRTIQIDKNAPSLGDLQLVKLKDESAGNKFADTNIDKRIPYTEDMWISGNWYLLGSVTDGNGVQELLWHDGSTSHTLVEGNNTTNTGAIKDSAKVKTLGAAHSTDYPDPEYPDDETKKITITAYDYEFFIPIGATSEYGTINYSLSAVDATNERNSVSRTIKVNYDCTAPEFKATVSSSDDAAELSATGNKIQNSSGMYSVYGTFDEEGKQSGFARIAMYFTRTIKNNGVTTTNIIDPMVTKDKATGTNDKKNNYYPSTGFSYTSVVNQGDGIYWKELTGGSTSGNTITISSIPVWVRKGGLCKVDGVIYKIKTVTTSALTVDGTLTSGAGKTVYVSPALVIDNLSSESKKQGQTYNGLYNKDAEDTNVISGGDGDWLIEGVSQQSSSYPWTASLNSQNMLDGPVTIHFVAFDKAGNATEKSYSGNVANNAPRLAGVTVWTDYNGNGKGWRNSTVNGVNHATDYEDETKSRYYSRVRPIVDGTAMDRSKDVTSKLIVSGNQNDAEGIAAASSTAFMKVTDTVRFIPEIVGGNGALNYEYKIGKKAAFTVNATTKEVTGFTPNTTAGSKAMQSSDKVAITKDDGTAVSGTDDGQDVPTATDSNSVTYVNGNTDSVITFDGATILGELDNSTSDDPTWFDVVISDSTEGDTKLSCEMQIALQINYTDETSPVVKIRPFYWNSKTNNSVIWATNGNPEGHIELEGDLPTSFAAETGVNDRDPKVSGKIKLEGYAYDDIKLKELYVKFDNHTKLNTDNFKVADYTPSQQTKWTVVTHNTNDGWDFSAEDVYCNGNGHLVHWTLTIDTAARTTVAATDQAVVVYAKDDRGGHTSGHDSTTAQTSITTKRWGEVTSQEKASANYYEDFYYNTKVSDSTPDTALVYKGPDSYIWKNVKAQENAKTIYYTDFYCGTNATDTTSDNTVVYKDTLSYRYQMDIVPYVTEIVTHLSPYSVSNPSVYARTALGNYPVYEGETIQFKGFNIGTNIAEVTIPGMNETTLKNGTVNNEANKSNTITLTKGTGSGARSGDITLTVNSIPALNNTNKDDAKGNYSGDIADSNYTNGYNRQPNGVNNNLLNDDISLDVWQFLNAAEPRNGKSDNPTMKISSQGRIGISYSNAVVYFSAPFIDNSDQQSRNNIKSQTAIAQNYGWFTNNTFCFDPYGYPYAAAQSPDTDNSKGAAYLQFFSRKAGKNITAMGLNENYQKIANSSRIEAICIPINKDENDWTTDIERTQSIAMTATMPNPNAAPSDNNKVTVHMAYWDNLTKQIRYRQGQVGANPDSFGFVGENDWDGNMRNYGGSLLDLQGRRSAQQEAGGRYESVYDSISSKFTDGNTNNRSAAIKAQKIYRVAGKSIGTEYAAAYQVTTPIHGGKYVDLGVLPSTAKNTPTVVMCWYDADAKRLVVSYDTPSNSDAKDSTGMCNGDWQTNAQYIGTKGGMYCRMAIDGDDGIHIAHYDYLGADLLYTYIPSVNSIPQISSATTYVIDSYLSVGTWCTIDVAKELKAGSTTEYNYVPQIGYFAPASEDSTAAARIAKAARFDDKGRPLFAGVENDKFTGAWEISIIPTQSIPIIDRVNVGMYKDAKGVLGVIPTGGDNRISVSKVDKPGYPVSDSTTVYGNGTTNPAVVYCLDDGPVELAQKK